MIRTKSGRLIEKTIYITEEDYEKMMKEGGDPSSILNKYLKPEERGTIESWEKVPEPGMKVRAGSLAEPGVLGGSVKLVCSFAVEVEPRFVKQYKCQYCCSCKN